MNHDVPECLFIEVEVVGHKRYYFFSKFFRIFGFAEVTHAWKNANIFGFSLA